MKKGTGPPSPVPAVPAPARAGRRVMTARPSVTPMLRRSIHPTVDDGRAFQPSSSGSTSCRSAPRACSKPGSAVRTTSQNAGEWFISRRWASSCVTT